MAGFIELIKGLVAITRYLPELFGLITKLAKMIKNAIDDAERDKLNNKFNEALKDAKQTKDTTKVEDLFGGVQAKLVSDKQEPELVQKTKIVKIQSFDIKFIKPVKKEKLSIDLSKTKMGFSFMSASSSVIVSPTVNPTTPRNVSTMGSGMGGSMGSKLLSLAFLLLLSSCRSGDKLPGVNAPTYKPEIFAGDSVNGGITRSQTNQFISAQDPEFDNYLAVHSNTMSCIFQTYVNNCEKFKSQIVECKPAKIQDIKNKIERIENN